MTKQCRCTWQSRRLLQRHRCCECLIYQIRHKKHYCRCLLCQGINLEPDITGEFCQQYSGEASTVFGGFHMNSPVLTGAFEKGRKVSRSCAWQTYGDDYGLKIRLSKANAMYGKSTSVQPKTFQHLTIIKV